MTSRSFGKNHQTLRWSLFRSPRATNQISSGLWRSLCHRKKKPKPLTDEKPQPDGGSIHELSILEKSLCYDRVRELCRFRIRHFEGCEQPAFPAQHCPLSDPARTPSSPQFEDLRNKIPEPIRTFVSESGRNFESWLRNTVWEVLDTAENLENRNRVLLDRLMDRDAQYPFIRPAGYCVCKGPCQSPESGSF